MELDKAIDEIRDMKDGQVEPEGGESDPSDAAAKKRLYRMCQPRKNGSPGCELSMYRCRAWVSA